MARIASSRSCEADTASWIWGNPQPNRRKLGRWRDRVPASHLMPTRSRLSSGGVHRSALIVLALLFACLKGRSPTDASASDVRFDLRAQSVSGGSVLHITVVYLDQPTNSETVVPVILLDQRINVAAGTQSLPLTIDLTRCLADPLHLSGSNCELEAGVVLEQNGQAVDSVGVGPITVTPGQTVNANASLVPVGGVVVFPDTASLTVGAVTVLGDSVFSPTNVYLPNTTVTWTSTDTTIAKVNASGAVTGIGAGTTTVTASAGGQSGFARRSLSPASRPAAERTLDQPAHWRDIVLRRPPAAHCRFAGVSDRSQLHGYIDASRQPRLVASRTRRIDNRVGSSPT